MLKKLTAPYKYAPARVSIERIDAALAAGAQAELQSSGRRGRAAVDLVTFRTPDGRIVDQFPVSGHVASTAQFVASYNRTLAAMPPPAPPQPPPGYYPQQPPLGYPQQGYYPPPPQQGYPPQQPPPGWQGQPPQQQRP